MNGTRSINLLNNLLRLLMEGSELPKRPTDVLFTKDGETILVGDKFGDVFR
jgi:hypothetical protein